jgi:hypothetical protein
VRVKAYDRADLSKESYCISIKIQSSELINFEWAQASEPNFKVEVNKKPCQAELEFETSVFEQCRNMNYSECN